MRLFKVIAQLLLLSFYTQVQAVHVSYKGAGEVLIFPYYTVNNELNTLYSIVNTSADAKAIKINFYESHNARDVLSFNVYLSAFDVWTGALAPMSSTVAGFNGEDSVWHYTGDQSCAPYLLRSGQEFLPNDFVADNNNELSRLRSGFFVAIEMGVLSGFAEDYVSHDNSGIPFNCTALEQAWSVDAGDPWSLNTTVFQPSGGLIGSAQIVDVAEGVSFSYDATALSNFSGDEIFHTSPHDNTPDLSYAIKTSEVLLPDGDLAESTWEHGFQAVSAVLMQSEIYNDYALDGFINGKTEWVVTMPTKFFHTNLNQADTEPFSSQWNGSTSCDSFKIDFYDREQQFEFPITGIPRPPTIDLPPNLCWASNVLRILLPAADVAVSGILGGETMETLRAPAVAVATESGWAKIKFVNESNMNSNDYRLLAVSGPSYKGLPVTGFAVQKFTNAGARQGLLAQYGSLFMHKGLIEVED
ncbi:hypothetical protein OS175_03835 [Marinicella sp. S1101]|uniref:hypothetical protein n=1 Tax=Marinicella marina TaxID=2996016 RepID=UPI002260900A|nr:hypothetical protein [Marinicella marina]MCX7552998.1 hypothetical protein [Marinicella marina]MDJ1139692.1 hypothetical protein [Marinicella marina]